MTDGPVEVVFLDGPPEPSPVEELPSPGPGGGRRRLAFLAGAVLVLAGGLTLARTTGDGGAPAPSSPAPSASPPALGVTPAARPIPLPTEGATLGMSEDQPASLQLVGGPLCPVSPCTYRPSVPALVRRTVLAAFPKAQVRASFSVYHDGRLVSREVHGRIGHGRLLIDVIEVHETQSLSVEASVHDGAVRGTAEVNGYLVAAQVAPAGPALFLPLQKLLGRATAIAVQ